MQRSTYTKRYNMLIVGFLLVGISSLLVSSPANAEPRVNGNTVTLSERGWIEVQNPQNFTTVCQGQDSCVAPPGTYTVINHKNGDRFYNILVDDSSEETTDININGNRINLPDDGWYQVQDATTFVSQCEGLSFCDVVDGTYIVINHTTGARATVTVDNNNVKESSVNITANTISWPNDGWYQVQRADTLESVCEGTRQCVVPQGNYIVINHTTGERFEPITVTGSAETTAGTLPSLPAPLKLAERCIGSVNQTGVLFCVNPDTREFSATLPDSSLWWGFTLPGENSTNSVEAVLTVGDFVLLIANRHPGVSSLTADERANQFEASVFKHTGSFLRTITLGVDLRVPASNEKETVIARGDQFGGMPARVVAFERSGANPQLLFGWHRFRVTSPSSVHKWDTAGISRFDLVTGQRLASQIYPEQQIDELALDPNQPEVVRVTTSRTVEWLATDTLTPVADNYFQGLDKNALVLAPDTDLTQINADNYLEIVERVLPWVNGESAEQFKAEGPLILATNDSEIIARGTDEEFYARTVSACQQSGIKTRLNVRHVSIQNTIMDNCRFNALTYNGSYHTDFVGRDGGSRRFDMSVFDNEGNVSIAALDSSVGYSRVADGQSRSDAGTTITYLANKETEAVGNYFKRISYFFGRDSGSSCFLTETNAAGELLVLTCTPFTAQGSIDANFTINANWSTYTNIDVDFNIEFGDRYYADFNWYNRETGERLPDKPIPQYYLDRLSPPNTFLVREGLLSIKAADGSKLEATVVGNDGQLVHMRISLFDQFGNSLGNFSDLSIEVPCAGCVPKQ